MVLLILLIMIMPDEATGWKEITEAQFSVEYLLPTRA